MKDSDYCGEFRPLCSAYHNLLGPDANIPTVEDVVVPGSKDFKM